MPIKLPNLDDRTFADLVTDAQALIPVHAPEWTNHNESDPGITFIELFAYLTEMLIYRLNRVTDANRCAFLKLIDGIERTPSPQHAGMIIRAGSQEEVSLNAEVQAVILKLRQQDRAVTCEDFDRLALAVDPKVERAYCVPQRDLTSATPYEKALNHVSVVILPTEGAFDYVFLFDGTNFIDVTLSASGANDTKVALLPPSGVSPFLYLGSSAPFGLIRFVLADLADAGQGYNLGFNYFDGKQNDWVQLTATDNALVDGTSNLSSSGFVAFTSPPNWKTTVVNNQSMYWLSVSTSQPPTKTTTVNSIFLDLISSQIFLDLKEATSQYLEPRRLLTTRVHVVGPRFLTIGVHLSVHLKPDAKEGDVGQAVKDALTVFFNPHSSGPDNPGWPFGRSVYVSEIYKLLNDIPGIDFVTRAKVVDPKTGKETGQLLEILTAYDSETGQDISNERRTTFPEGVADGELVAINLQPDELVNFSIKKSTLEYEQAAETD
jgi:hypothetical protein